MERCRGLFGCNVPDFQGNEALVILRALLPPTTSLNVKNDLFSLLSAAASSSREYQCLYKCARSSRSTTPVTAPYIHARETEFTEPRARLLILDVRKTLCASSNELSDNRQSSSEQTCISSIAANSLRGLLLPCTQDWNNGWQSAPHGYEQRREHCRLCETL